MVLNAGLFDRTKSVELFLSVVRYQRPLIPELSKALIDAGCNPAAQDNNGWDLLVWLAQDDHPADPQVTDLFLSAGCRANLDGCSYITAKLRDRFERILKEHAEWKESLGRMAAENSPASTFYSPDWGR